MILAGKRLLITGVITKDSIAFHAAEQAQREGASVVLTSFGRVRRMTERAALADVEELGHHDAAGGLDQLSAPVELPLLRRLRVLLVLGADPAVEREADHGFDLRQRRLAAGGHRLMGAVHVPRGSSRVGRPQPDG